jgi:hypothetical protein
MYLTIKTLKHIIFKTFKHSYEINFLESNFRKKDRIVNPSQPYWLKMLFQKNKILFSLKLSSFP